MQRGRARGVLPRHARRRGRADRAVRPARRPGRRLRNRGSRRRPSTRTWRGGCGSRPAPWASAPPACSIWPGRWFWPATSGRDDVVFGTRAVRTHAGRRRRRPGAGDVHQHPADAHRRWATGQRRRPAVRRTHALLAELLRTSTPPLGLAQRCSGVPAPAPLFTALLNYRHSAMADARPRSRWVWTASSLLDGRRAHQLSARPVGGRPGRRLRSDSAGSADHVAPGRRLRLHGRRRWPV